MNTDLLECKIVTRKGNILVNTCLCYEFETGWSYHSAAWNTDEGKTLIEMKTGSQKDATDAHFLLLERY
jgi:hypothetical protein